MNAVLSEKKLCIKRHSHYSEEDLAQIDSCAVPEHVAIIMDGNRRWAQTRHLPPHIGHVRGAGQLKQIVEAAIEMKIQTLTVYAFSTENRNRPQEEVNLLFSLFKKYLLQERDEMKKNGICLETIGNASSFPPDLQKVLDESKAMTKEGRELKLILAVNYGARDEMTRAIQNLVQDQQKDQNRNRKITEGLVESYLDTAGHPDPQLLIRTSGEFRLSNFLLWQISYTEIIFSKVCWPDFTPHHLLEAIQSYQKRKIRRGL